MYDHNTCSFGRDDDPSGTDSSGMDPKFYGLISGGFLISIVALILVYYVLFYRKNRKRITLKKPITKKETTCGSSSIENIGEDKTVGFHLGYTYAVSSMQGWRVYMEDRHIICDAYSNETVKTYTTTPINLPVNHALFSVLDGHGGKFASDYASRQLVPILCQQKSFLDYIELIESSDKQAKIGSNQLNMELKSLLEESLENAFVDLDFSLKKVQQDMSVNLDTKGSLFCSKNADIEKAEGLKMNSFVKDTTPFSGTTAVVVLVTPQFIICANLGDCRAVLHSTSMSPAPYSQVSNKTEALSVDHKPDAPKERDRIESRGGVVKHQRVNGLLGVSRSLGDYEYKDYSPHNKEETGLMIARRQRVSPIPDISVNALNADQEKFLVLACDGVWDVLNNQECCDLIQNMLQEGKSDLGLICEKVLDECLDRGSRDNMTMIVVKFSGRK